jgi:hypothetical protein
MKKFIFTLLLLSLFVKIDGQVLYRLEGGANISRITGHESNIYQPFLGYSVGGSFEKLISNPVSFYSGAFYSSRGFKSFYLTENSVYKTSRRDNATQSTLYIPLLVVLHYKPFSLTFGFHMQFLLSSRQLSHEIETRNDNPTYYRNTVYYDRYEFPKAEHGITVGLIVPVFPSVDLSFRYVQAFKQFSYHYQWTRFANYQISIAKQFGKPLDYETIKKMKPKSSTEQSVAYSIKSKQNISRVEFRKIGIGNKVQRVIRLDRMLSVQLQELVFLSMEL